MSYVIMADTCVSLPFRGGTPWHFYVIDGELPTAGTSLKTEEPLALSRNGLQI